MPGTMLIYDFMPVGTPFEGAARWMLAAPTETLAAAAAVAFECPEPHGRLEHGTVRSRRDALVLDFYWAARPTVPVPFDHVEGELQFAPLSAGRSHLSLSASYEPFGRPSMSVERSQLQREAEVRVRQFLAIIAAAVPNVEKPSA
ncbi:MAG: hypothetical protein WD271_12230 [Acidimicrobiia bacterium]